MAFRKALKRTAIIGGGAVATVFGLSQLIEYRKKQVRALGFFDRMFQCFHFLFNKLFSALIGQKEVTAADSRLFQNKAIKSVF